MRDLIIVTPTWRREERLDYMARFAGVLRDVKSAIWLVIEDAQRCDPDLAQLLMKTGLNYRYWAAGPSRDKGNIQRESAYNYILAEGLTGVIYNADDDNLYLPRVFEELRNVVNVGLLPVGNLGPNGVERPIVRKGKIVGWDADWLERRYPVDMAGFAFCSSLLKDLDIPLWCHVGVGGESEFIERILGGVTPLEFLCDGCTTCLVWHNHSLSGEECREMGLAEM